MTQLWGCVLCHKLCVGGEARPHEPECGIYPGCMEPLCRPQEIADWLRHIDRLDEIPGARNGLPLFNPLWDAAEAIEREFGTVGEA